MTNILVTIEDLAKTAVIDVETFADTEYHAFLTASKPFFDDLKAFAVTTGKTDVATLLSDLKTALANGIVATLASGGNIGTGLATVAATEIKALGGEIATDAKNALYGGLAIVAADIPQIAGTPVPTVAPIA